jgi:hypothetical protein
MREISKLEVIAFRNKTTTQQDEGWPGRTLVSESTRLASLQVVCRGRGQRPQPKLYVLQKGYAVALMLAVEPT